MSRNIVPALALALLLSCSSNSAPSAPPSAPPEAPPAVEKPPVLSGMPGLTGPDLLSLVGKFDKGALVNIWASWCGSCKKELPMLAQVHDEYGPHGLGLVLVSADEPNLMPAARKLLDEVGITQDAYYLAGRVSLFKRAVEPRWQGAVPATLLIDKRGKVRYFWNGPVLAEEISPIAQGFLSGEEIDGMSDLAAKP